MGPRLPHGHCAYHVNKAGEIEVARIGGDVSADPDADHAMDALAEYHLGTPGDAARQDSEMTRLYELHHGTV